MVSKVRAWVWLEEVLWRAGCSLTALGGRLLGEDHVELRAFTRVRRNGWDPGRKRPTLGNRSLVEVVAELDGYEQTRNIYEHAIWVDLLGPKERLSPVSVSSKLKELLTRFGFYELDEADVYVASQLSEGPAAQIPRSADNYREALQPLIESGTLDGIELLSLMYRRAMSNGQLEQAIALRDALYYGVRHFCDRPGFTGQIQAYLLHLIHRRVVCGMRDLTPTAEAAEKARLLMEHHHQKKGTTRARAALAEVEYMLSIDFTVHRQANFLPLLPVTDALSAYLKNRNELVKRSTVRAVGQAELAFREAMEERLARDADEA